MTLSLIASAALITRMCFVHLSRSNRRRSRFFFLNAASRADCTVSVKSREPTIEKNHNAVFPQMLEGLPHADGGIPNTIEVISRTKTRIRRNTPEMCLSRVANPWTFWSLIRCSQAGIRSKKTSLSNQRTSSSTVKMSNTGTPATRYWASKTGTGPSPCFQAMMDQTT